MTNNLDPSEKELLNSVDNDEWELIPNFDHKKDAYEAAADATIGGMKSVSVDLTEQDFQLAHKKASEQGISYQSFLSGVIHKFLVGKLHEH